MDQNSTTEITQIPETNVIYPNAYRPMDAQIMQELKIIRAQLTNERRRCANQHLDEFGSYQALAKDVSLNHYQHI